MRRQPHAKPTQHTHTHTHTLYALFLTALTPIAALSQVTDINASAADVKIKPPGGAVNFGSAVCSVGSITATPDIFSDVLVAAHTGGGKAWVFFGPLGTLDRSGAFVFDGLGANSGPAIDGGGDFDGDGVPDILFGDPPVDSGPHADRGRVRVFSGVDGSVIRQWFGEGTSSQMGTRVRFFPNVDGNPGDEVLVLFDIANTAGVPRTQLRSFAVNPGFIFEFDGLIVSNAGIVESQDTFPDIAIGLPLDDTNGVDAGYITYRTGNTGSLIQPQFGPASVAGEQLGGEVVFMSDLNGDGLGDVLTSGVEFDSMRGRVRVISGEVPFHATIRQFDGEAVGDQFGKSIANVGDINGDGVSDIAIGAPLNDPLVFGVLTPDAGKVYLYSGATSELLMTFSGVAENDQFGAAVSSAGDFNGDGILDLIISAPGNTSPLSGSGMVYIFFLPCTTPADLNGDGIVNSADLATLLATWGPCPPPCSADLNGDGVVDSIDLASLLANWGVCVPSGTAMAGPTQTELDGQMLLDPAAPQTQQVQASGDAFFLTIIGQLGFTDLQSYYDWLGLLNDSELSAHIKLLLDAILGNSK